MQTRVYKFLHSLVFFDDGLSFMSAATDAIPLARPVLCTHDTSEGRVPKLYDKSEENLAELRVNVAFVKETV